MAWQKRFWIATAGTVLALALPLFPLPWWSANAASLIALIAASSLFPEAWRALHTRAADRFVLESLALLVLVAAAIADCIHRQPSAAAIIASVFATLALAVEALAQRARSEEQADHAQRRVAAALGALPETVIRIERGERRSVPRTELAIGNTILLEDNTVVPADVTIIEGSPLVDETTLVRRDESVQKLPGQRLYAGTRLVSGRCLARVTSNECTRDRVEHALQREDTALSLASQHTIMTTVTVSVVLALVAGAVWTLLAPPAVPFVIAGVLFTGTLLTAALAVTASTARTRALAGMDGIVLASGLVAEKLMRADTIVLDRALVRAGAYTIDRVASFKPYTQQQVLNMAATLEQPSVHAIARAIVAFSKRHGALSFQKPSEWTETPGKGVTGTVNGKVYRVGNAAYFEHLALPQEAQSLSDEGLTIIYVVAGEDILGYLAIMDQLGEQSADLVKSMRSFGRVVLLSGDHSDTAASAGRALGVHEIIPDVPRTDIAATLTQMREEGKHIAFVTRDENLAGVADVTIVVGGREQIGSTDVVILSRDVSLVARVFALARESRVRAAQNKRLCAAAAVVSVPLAAGAFATLVAPAVTALAAAAITAATRHVLAWNSGRV